MADRQAPYRVGIVGAGNISRLHLEGMARHGDRVEAVALCDIDPAALAARAAEFGVADGYLDLDEMITQAGLDAAIVATPTHVRSEVVLPLIDAGIAVLCEKPFAETYAEAAEIELAARAAHACLAVGQNFRRHFTFRLARELLGAGQLGHCLHVTQADCHLRRDTGWRLERRRYVMAVMAIHWFDGYRCLLGDEADWVHCTAVNSPATPGGDDTAVAVTIGFAGGAVASLSLSFSSFAGGGFCWADCENGGLSLTCEHVEEVRGDGRHVRHENPFDKAEATYHVLDDLLRAVEQEREPETSAADNLGSMRIMEAAYRSLADGRTVRTEEIQ